MVSCKARSPLPPRPTQRRGTYFAGIVAAIAARAVIWRRSFRSGAEGEDINCRAVVAYERIGAVRGLWQQLEAAQRPRRSSLAKLTRAPGQFSPEGVLPRILDPSGKVAFREGQVVPSEAPRCYKLLARARVLTTQLLQLHRSLLSHPIKMVYAHSALALAATALLAAAPAQAGLYPKSSKVLQITPKNYDRLVAQSNYTTVCKSAAKCDGQ